MFAQRLIARHASTFTHLHRRFYNERLNLLRRIRALTVTEQHQQQHRATTMDSSHYAEWSKENLIARIQLLEAAASSSSSSPSSDPAQQPPSASSKPTRLERKQAKRAAALPTAKSTASARHFNFADHPTRKVLFRLAYLGWPYQGFASQAHTTETVEHHLFTALRTCRLIDPALNAGDIPQACDYSRCGRTDKGVSATGNAVCLNVRSRLKNDEQGHDDKDKDKEELPYLAMLNRCLPDHIRVLAWAPVEPDFSARFSCGARTYKYFLPGFGLDIARMHAAASAFVGTHDFRNFCKIDSTKPERNYERSVLSVTIEPATELCSGAHHSTGVFPWYVLTVKGTAFLWHQIRCMVHVLLLVGQGLEHPSVVADLLDLTKYPAKPQYDLAPELPLVLWDCDFPQVTWRYSDAPASAQALGGLVKHLATMYETHKVQTMLVDTLLAQVLSAKLDPASAALVGGKGTYGEVVPGLKPDAVPWGVNGSLVPVVGKKGTEASGRAHLKLAKRKTCDTVEEKAGKREARLKRKADAEAEAEAAAGQVDKKVKADQDDRMDDE
ncbi:pseudouridine synthase [Catenaria anguillulae PL171]|uniref:Pseudouridine synthase n=1 Tax=Catenaria anguillulae PL171 TaxID=765915 RepID=A0A1Y2HQY7_9FUNG|nr:pseudouridine synthase [Catenaria anguillulae PL171]